MGRHRLWALGWHVGFCWFLSLGWDGRVIPGWGLRSLPALPPDRLSSSSSSLIQLSGLPLHLHSGHDQTLSSPQP